MTDTTPLGLFLLSSEIYVICYSELASTLVATLLKQTKKLTGSQITVSFNRKLQAILIIKNYLYLPTFVGVF